jgi:hypothetical protein
MNVEVPFKIRLRGGPSGHHGGDFWTRRKYRDDLDVAKRPTHLVEDDLDHLGLRQKNRS